MDYVKYSIKTTTNACDDVCFMLSELGVEAVEIEDNIPVDDELQGGTFEELQPDMGEDDGTCKVNYYLEEPDDDLLSNVKDGLSSINSYIDIGEGSIEITFSHDEDWLNNWKEYFHAFSVGNILIKPTWDDDTTTEEGQTLINIDPGVAFGTGKHETTQLCISGLQKHLQDKDEVLDLGFGSGILSIVALKLGANHVTGTDIDPLCVESVEENFKVNDLPIDKGDFFIGDLTSDKKLQDEVGYEKYDVVVANILADIIISMAPCIPQTMKKGAYLITSGIIDFKEDEVKNALENQDLEIVEINHQGEWVNITARKK